MLTLNDGRSELWQWDTGRKLSVDAECSQVHFSNKFFGRSIDVDVVDGVAIIPDILLQSDNDLMAWGFVGSAENGYTKISKIFKVNKRNKPSDYVFTPPDQTTLQEILSRLEEVENKPDGGITSDSITKALGYVPLSGFYFTERKEFPNALNIKSADIYALYEGLTPIWNELTDDDGSATGLREYIFSTGQYNVAGERGDLDADIRKPVILVMSGMHGLERSAILSTYRFFEDLVARRNIPSNIPEEVIFKVVPLVNPWGTDHSSTGGEGSSSTNENGVNINRDFAAFSQKETRALRKWFRENAADTKLLLDVHNSGNLNEVTMFVGLNDNAMVAEAKRTALRGVGKVIPYWKNVIGYPDDAIYSYTSYKPVKSGEDGGVYYAARELGIPAIAEELSAMQNGSTEFFSPETIAAGAEGIGNVIAQFVEEIKIPKLSSLTNVAEVGA